MKKEPLVRCPCGFIVAFRRRDLKKGGVLSVRQAVFFDDNGEGHVRCPHCHREHHMPQLILRVRPAA